MHSEKSPLTLMANTDELITQLNDDCADDLMTMARYYSQSHAKPTPKSVRLVAIYQEGLGLLISNDDGDFVKNLRFATPITGLDELHTAYALLLDKSAKAIGTRHLQVVDDEFVVQSVQKQGNFYQLSLSLPKDTPKDWAGLAYLIKIGDEQRYYTLRKAWDDGGLCGRVDVFTHGDGLGSRWVRMVQAGDVIASTRRYPEKTAHLTGKRLLIADETSLPTALRLVELSPDVEYVLVACVCDLADLAYLDDCDGLNRDWVMTVSYKHPKELTENLKQSLILLCQTHHFDSAWGALEVGVVKELKSYAYSLLALDKERAVFKAYWRDL